MRRKGINIAALSIVIGILLIGVVYAEDQIQETDNFKFLVPDTWQFIVYENGTVQIYNRMATYMVELKKEGYNLNDADWKSSMKIFVEQYKGSDPVVVEMLGFQFLKTTFDYSGTHQSLYTTLLNGEKISIGIMGPEYETDEKIQAILKSIEIKKEAATE
jgi:hypothetical protein